ncbi:hypothetical protein OEZ85_007901 [Tetradesmus obliquus]|uniref:GB1/RHD3-type G domain-containing protein n=1 Tax=Tetradesmus obliquus TaxID=3088 RepID=A0ABY8THU2_TETOB|nr:hypothetical protein OEZ85_007901 [Tetradesmus obliquus]
MASSWFRRGSTSSAVAEPSNAQAAQGKPLVLIGFNEATSSWEVGQEAMRVLQTIPGPLCTVSVCGRARQGKSFLLNQILSKFTSVDKPQGFVVSPTHQSCTRGIWIWSAPITMIGPDGRKLNTILMDCEGVDAVDQGQQHSAQIFSLAVLLSSIFIYNQIGAIDAIAIERMAMVCSLAKRIRDKSQPVAGSRPLGTSSATGQVDFSPAFIWLLRDFQLRLESNGKQITPAEYLEEALLPVKGGEADIANRNQMRTTIKAVFPDRDVATLVRPALSESHLQRLDTLPYSSLRPEFRRDMDIVMRLVASKARPLAVGGSLVSGKALAALTAAYVDAVNHGAVPQLVTAWQGVSRAETQKAFDEAAAAYGQRFKPDLDGSGSAVEEQQLYELHQTALGAALSAFKSGAMGEAELVGEFEAKLRQQLEATYQEARRKLAVSGERVASEMLAAESGKLRALMAGPGASVEAVESELRRFLDEYDLKVPSGPYKYKKAAEFLMNTTIIGIKGIVQNILKAKEEAAARAAAAEAKVAELRTDLARLSEADSRASDAAAQLSAAQQEAARLRGQLEAKARHVSTLEAELSTARQSEASGSAAQQQLQQQLAAAKAEGERLKEQLGEVVRLQQQLQGLQGQLQQAGQREAAALSEKAAAQQEATRLAGQLSTEQGRISQLQAENTAGRSELDSLRSTVAELRQQLEGAQVSKVQESHLQGQLEEERRKVTAQMQEIATLTNDLMKERNEHDNTRNQLAQAKTAAARPSSAGNATPAAGSGGARVTPAAAAGAGGRQRKRARTAAEDEDDAMADAEQHTPLPAEAEPAAEPASAAAAPPGGIDKDINPEKMTIQLLKAWVTDSSLEDEEFFKLSQSSKTKKTDWVTYVKKKLAAC